MEEIENFSTWLTHTRESRKISKAELARRSGLSKAAITHYEKGERLPDPSTIKNLAKGLRVQIEDILMAIGLLSSKVDTDGDLRQWEYILSKLPQEDRDWLLQIAYLRLEQQEKEEKK